MARPHRALDQVLPIVAAAVVAALPFIPDLVPEKFKPIVGAVGAAVGFGLAKLNATWNGPWLHE